MYTSIRVKGYAAPLWKVAFFLVFYVLKDCKNFLLLALIINLIKIYVQTILHSFTSRRIASAATLTQWSLFFFFQPNFKIRPIHN